MQKNRTLCGYVDPKFNDQLLNIEINVDTFKDLALAKKYSKKTGKAYWIGCITVFQTRNGKWMVCINDYEVKRTRKYFAENAPSDEQQATANQSTNQPTPPEQEEEEEEGEDDSFFA